METLFQKGLTVLKVDRRLGVIFGYGAISKINGKPYLDTQRHHIPEESIVEKALDYMLRKRTGSEMHRKQPRKDGEETPPVRKRGTVVFCMPMTEEIAKAYNIQTTVSGLMIGWRPDDDCREEILAKFDTGEYTGFSIGGRLFKAEPFDPEVAE